MDGRPALWGKYFEEKFGKICKKCDEAFYEYWFGGPLDVLYPDWP